MRHCEFEPASRRFPVICLAILLAAGAGAGHAGPAELELTWQDVVGLVEAHPSLAAAAHRVTEARAGADQARAIPNPTLEAGTARAKARDFDRSRTEWEVSLEIPLGWLIQRGPRIAGAEAGLAAADGDARARRRELLTRVQESFWSLVQEQEQVASLAALAEQTSALEQAVIFRVQKGEARPLEETRARLEAERLAGDLAVARRSLAAHRVQFGLQLGLDGGQEVVATADLAALPALPDSTALQAAIDTGHPLLQAARARVRGLDADLDLARRQRIPAPNLRPFLADELDGTVQGIAVQFELPLGNRNAAGIALAEARLAAEERSLAADRLQMQSFAVETLAACRNGIEMTSRYRQRILPLAESAAATVERAFLLGEAALFEVIDARRDLVQVRSAYLAVLARTQIDCARLRTAVGEE